MSEVPKNPGQMAPGILEGVTKIVKGTKEVEALAYAFLERANGSYILALTDNRIPKNTGLALELIKAIFSKNSSFKFQLIADIQSANLQYYKQIEQAGVEIRHIEGNKVSFALTMNEYIAIPLGAMEELIATEGEIPREVVWSTRNDVISQTEQIFNVMWKSAVPARIRMLELEEGRPHVETKVIRDPLEILEETKRMARASRKYSVASVSGGLLYAQNSMLGDFTDIMDRCRKGEHGGVRWLTSIDSSSIGAAKRFLDLGIEIRHLANVPTESFGFSETEVGMTVSRLEGGTLSSTALFSDDPMYIEHYSNVFEELWRSAIDARTRIKEIEEGIEVPIAVVINDPNETREKFLSLVSGAEHEILILFPSTSAFHREESIGVIELIEKKAELGKIQSKMLTAFDADIRKKIASGIWQSGTRHIEAQVSSGEEKIAIRDISPEDTKTTATIVIIDRSRSLIIEQKDKNDPVFSKAIGMAMYSNSKPIVNSYYLLFNKLWKETVLRQREEKSRKQSELLQDVLTHDIRNHNQAARLGAELLAENLRGKDKSLEFIASAVIQAIDGSTQLVDKAKRLGKIIAEGKPELHPVDLIDSIDRSLLLVKRSYPEKEIKETKKIIRDSSSPALAESSGILVMADDLIDDVFLNLFSNCVKFTQGTTVPIDILIEETKNGGDLHPLWNVAVADYGQGIPFTNEDVIFQRYSKGKRGSGLGLSIVHALVADRYGGNVEATNRGHGQRGAIIRVMFRGA